MPVSIWTKKQKEEREEKEGGESSKRERGRKSWENGGVSLAGDRLDHLWRLGVLRILPTDSSQVSLCVLVHPVPPTGCPPPFFLLLVQPLVFSVGS